ncbi:MAG TPA: STAS domain-containing protein [Trebonia sp.]|jgi:anti-anti-sigma factor|nr:STAS domain-containing protein [Trebonia sp.]
MDFELSVCAAGRCVIAALGGECDTSDAARLRERLLGVVASHPSRIVVDLSRLGFLDCAGARVLARAGRRARLKGGSLVLAAPTAQVSRLIAVTGANRRLATYPDVAAALADLCPGDRPPGPADRVPALPLLPSGLCAAC